MLQNQTWFDLDQLSLPVEKKLPKAFAIYI
jgi:hypothetical protein